MATIPQTYKVDPSRVKRFRPLSAWNRWVASRRAKPRCGVFPFQLPRWFTMTECCGEHDTSYVFLSVEAAQELVVQGVEVGHEKDWLKAHYMDRVLQVDREFDACMREKVNDSDWYVQWWYEGLRSVFSRTVDDVGFECVWLPSVLETVRILKPEVTLH